MRDDQHRREQDRKRGCKDMAVTFTRDRIVLMGRSEETMLCALPGNSRVSRDVFEYAISDGPKSVKRGDSDSCSFTNKSEDEMRLRSPAVTAGEQGGSNAKGGRKQGFVETSAKGA